MDAFLRASLPDTDTGLTLAGGTLRAAAHDDFSTAMANSILLPAAVAAGGACVTAFFAKPSPAPALMMRGRLVAPTGGAMT